MELENSIQIIADDDILLDEAFMPFIEGEAKANSYRSEENKYLSDYYEDYSKHEIDNIHYMEEDIKGDGKNELLINVHWKYNDGIILLFNGQDRNYIEREPILYGMNCPKVNFYPHNQIVEITATGWARSFLFIIHKGSKSGFLVVPL